MRWHDFLIHVAVPGNNSLYAFVIDKLTERAEIADVRTSVIYEHLRNGAIAPVELRLAPSLVRGDGSPTPFFRGHVRKRFGKRPLVAGGILGRVLALAVFEVRRLHQDAIFVSGVAARIDSTTS